MSFDDWMERVNDVCEGDFGISIHDLPDMCFRDAFECGMSAEQFMAENLPDLEALRDLILS
jgi:hypothetical protein